MSDGETITPDDARTFWYGLELLSVTPDRWTSDYYRGRMEHLYEVMRGRANEGVTFNARAITTKQAAAVINLLEVYLDRSDLRLEAPKGCDDLASSYYGEYEWCDKCFAPMARISPSSALRKRRGSMRITGPPSVKRLALQ